MTVIDYIQQTCRRFTDAGLVFGHGTDNAFDEAAWLVLWFLEHPLDDLDTIAQHKLLPEQSQELDKLVQQRITTRKPLAYITQEAWLQGVPFYIDERSIIPRSLIAEVLVQGLLDRWLEYANLQRGDTIPRILDLCTGNGSLAILAAMAWPDAHLCATDISTDALDVALINVKRHQLNTRITLLQSDGLNAAELNNHSPFDMIICNPPYVNTQSMATLPQEYCKEPTLALAGGNDGMDFIRPLLKQAPNFLSSEGFLVLEIGNERDFFEAAFPTLDTIWLDTSAGEDQVLLLTHDALNKLNQIS